MAKRAERAERAVSQKVKAGFMAFWPKR